MPRRRYIRSQTLFDATDVAWPSFVSSQIIEFRNDNTLADSGGNFNALSLAAVGLLGPIVLDDDEDYVDLEIGGTIATLTSPAATDQGSNIYGVAYGLPHATSVVPTNFQHPVAERSQTLEDNFERGGWSVDGLAIVGVSSIPSVRSGSALSTDWPYAGNTLLVGDDFHMLYTILAYTGFATSGAGGLASTDVSGFRSIWVNLFVENGTTMVAGSPSALGLTMTVRANIYGSPR